MGLQPTASRFLKSDDQLAEEMLEYFGKDFVLPRKSKSSVPLRDSTEDSLLNSVETAGAL